LLEYEGLEKLYLCQSQWLQVISIKIKGVQMYTKQKGFLPIACFWAGSFLAFFCVFWVIVNAFSLIVSYRVLSSDEITTIVYRLITFPFGALMGVVIASLFPDMRVTKAGVDFIYLGLFRDQITWGEIKQLKRLEGLIIFNGSLGIGVVAPIYGGVKWQEKRSKKIP
jgi:hypothetical protein